MSLNTYTGGNNNMKEFNVDDWVMGGYDEQLEIVAPLVEERIDKGWEVPISTKYIKDKKMDYQVLPLITLYSRRTDGEEHRYLYENGQDSLTSNINEMEKLSGRKKRNIKNAVKKLTECDNEVVEIATDSEGRIYYKIIPKTIDKGIKKFVTIDSNQLEFLINTGNSNVIKTYCMIKVFLWDDKQCKYIKRPLTKDFLLKQIGMSVCKNNLDKMGEILQSLENNGYIKREKTIDKVFTNDRVVVKTTYTYELTSYEEWARKNRKDTKK